ncbi:epigen-like [Leucoraja erinacea]|uniref:epigen-like n=1 Tax=Leucoraja erinaceus TaxID=7782 RepID=UPI00245482D8|nr:epigen-like [Leucoraja erinacea]
MESMASVYIFSVLALAAAVSDPTLTPGPVTRPTVIAPHNQSRVQETHYGSSGRLMALSSKASCLQSDQDYCMNGICQYHEDSDLVTKYRICVCHPGYSGSRCQYAPLSTRTLEKSERYLYIAVGIGIGLSLSGLAVLLFYCLRWRAQERKMRYGACPRQANV